MSPWICHAHLMCWNTTEQIFNYHGFNFNLTSNFAKFLSNIIITVKWLFFKYNNDIDNKHSDI